MAEDEDKGLVDRIGENASEAIDEFAEKQKAKAEEKKEEAKESE